LNWGPGSPVRCRDLYRRLAGLRRPALELVRSGEHRRIRGVVQLMRRKERQAGIDGKAEESDKHDRQQDDPDDCDAASIRSLSHVRPLPGRRHDVPRLNLARGRNDAKNSPVLSAQKMPKSPKQGAITCELAQKDWLGTIIRIDTRVLSCN
jgi:hypothetical protein